MTTGSVHMMHKFGRGAFCIGYTAVSPIIGIVRGIIALISLCHACLSALDKRETDKYGHCISHLQIACLEISCIGSVCHWPGIMENGVSAVSFSDILGDGN